MTKKKVIGKHLKFYYESMNDDIMPFSGLCNCVVQGYLDRETFYLMEPENMRGSMAYWASGDKDRSYQHIFTPLRQTIVLFMAAINNEL